MSKYSSLFKNSSRRNLRENIAAGHDLEPGMQERGFTILLVDDDEGVLNALRRVFAEENYQILCASSATEALPLLGKGNHSPDNLRSPYGRGCPAPSSCGKQNTNGLKPSG